MYKKDTIQGELFQEEGVLPIEWYQFKRTELYKVYQNIPFDQLAGLLPEPTKGPGAPRWFSRKGMMALMFLKAYLNISDEGLVERFNTDWSLQLFCNKLFRNGEMIHDKAIVSRIRSYVSEHMDREKMQDILLNYWKRDISNTHVLLMDATCYESLVRFPTDVKLLWEATHEVFEKMLFPLCKRLGIKRPRSKYWEQKRKQKHYDRLQRKSWKKTNKRKEALLYLLNKGLDQLQSVLDKHPHGQLSSREQRYLKTIHKVLEQQRYLHHHPGSSIADRIVSLHKPYVRPIKRGKENKPVEFGMKAHMLQVGGICFFDTMDFKAFHEGNRLKVSTWKHKRWLGELHQLGADGIYATNKNRRFLTARNIFTCFPKKGPQTFTKSEKVLQELIARQRATVMEGSFGVHKGSYGLHKIRVQGAEKEKMMAFFAVMTANAVQMSKQESASPPQHQQAA